MLGVSADIPLEDAIGVCELAVASGWVVPPRKWVEWMKERAEHEALESLV